MCVWLALENYLIKINRIQKAGISKLLYTFKIAVQDSRVEALKEIHDASPLGELKIDMQSPSMIGPEEISFSSGGRAAEAAEEGD